MFVSSNSGCQSCKHYKNNSLLRQLSRVTKGNECSVSSHTNYRYLSAAQKDERLKRLHLELRNKTRRLHSLQKAISKLYDSDAIDLDKDESADFSDLLKTYASTIDQCYTKDSFQSLFWRQQLNAATKANWRSVR